MRRKGDGNPMAMLTGSFIYYAGVCVLLWRWPALLVFAGFVAVMMLQVLSEEKRLRRDFGEEYEKYIKQCHSHFSRVAFFISLVME